MNPCKLRRSVLLLALFASSCSSAEARAPLTDGHCLSDRQGRTICVPREPRRLSCDDVLCFESLLTLGESSRIVEMRGTSAQWLGLDPHVLSISKFDEPSLEQMLVDDIDVAFVYSNARALDRYQRAGIAALVGQSVARDASSAEKFLAGQKENLRLYAKVLGPKAAQRASMWESYVDDQVRFVTSRTSTLSPHERPTVYYLRGPDALTSHGTRGCPYWYTHLAGAQMAVAGTSNQGRATITAEQLILWNPEVVFVGRFYSVDLLLKDPRFRTLRAVEHNAVYPMPTGVFFWDGGPESVLLMLWAAKTVHPELFPDLDLARAIREYYSQFYGVWLDERALGNLLDGRSADGSRLVRKYN